MSRRLFPFFLVLMMFCPLTRAQDTSAQREQKEKLEKEIELINRQLSSTDSKSRSALSNYNLLSKKISNRKKLLEAHYSDAIPLDLMKTEQQKIAKELAAIDHEIDLHNITFEQISANLDMVLDIVENCGEAYRNASDTVKKLMN